jgi:hypothetical protein
MRRVPQHGQPHTSQSQISIHMPLPQSLRSVVVLVVGLAVGGVGAVLFRDSLPGAEGSPEARLQALELELQRARNRIAELEGGDASDSERGGVLHRLTNRERRRTLRDGTRDLAEELRAGRRVTPDDVFRATQPLMRDLAPLFDRMRVREQQKRIDSMAGELARKYDLNPQQQAVLKQWFEEKAAKEANAWTQMIGREGTRLQDVMRAAQDVRPDEGLDAFMPSVLSGDKLTQFQNERLTARADRVEQQADMKVQRLNSIVELDQAQRDQVFAIVARNSKEYDPRMVLDGSTPQIGAAPTGNTNEAILSVLRADQRAAYEIEMQRRREEAEKDMAAIGLSLPSDWDMFGDEFR